MAVDCYAVISRALLSLDNLEITPANGYYIARDGFGPGELTFRRQTAESIYSPGRVLVHVSPEQQTSSLKIRVKGSSSSDLVSKMNVLTAAFTQFSFILVVYLNDDLQYALGCEAADYSIGEGGQHQDMWLRANTEIITFQIPHTPVTETYIPPPPEP